MGKCTSKICLDINVIPKQSMKITPAQAAGYSNFHNDNIVNSKKRTVKSTYE